MCSKCPQFQADSREAETPRGVYFIHEAPRLGCACTTSYIAIQVWGCPTFFGLSAADINYPFVCKLLSCVVMCSYASRLLCFCRGKFISWCGGGSQTYTIEVYEFKLRSRAAERLYGPRVKTKHEPLAKQVVKDTQKAQPSRGIQGRGPLGNFLISRLLFAPGGGVTTISAGTGFAKITSSLKFWGIILGNNSLGHWFWSNFTNFRAYILKGR